MILDLIDKIGKIWMSLPVLPRKALIFSSVIILVGSFVIYITLRVIWVMDHMDVLGEMGFWQFIGF